MFKLTQVLGVGCVEFEATCFGGKVPRFHLEQLARQKISNPNSVHAPFFGMYGYDLSTASYKSFDDFVAYLVEFKDPLKLKKVVVHPPQDPHGSFDLFKERVCQLGSTGILPVLENLPEVSWTRLEEMFAILEQECGDVGVCYDFSHDILQNKREAIDTIPGWFMDVLEGSRGHLHLSACSWDEDLHLPFKAVPVFWNDILPKVKTFVKSLSIPKDELMILEIQPTAIANIGELVDSFVQTYAMRGGWDYWKRKLRSLFVKPLLVRKVRQQVADDA